MTSTQPAPNRAPDSSLDSTFDSLMRRIEHAASLRERQVAIDTLFERRRGHTPPYVIALTNPTRRNLP